MPNANHWSKLGLGTGILASLGRAASFSEVDRLVATMLDLGVTVIDTADTYGSGDCEILLGRVLRGRHGSFKIMSKAGYRHSNLPGPLRPLNQFVKKGMQRLGFHQCFTSSYLMSCINNSLSRLGLDHLDGLMLHNPPLDAVADESTIPFYQSLIDSGKAGLVGVSSESPKVIRAAIESGVFNIIQTPAGIKAAPTMRPLWKDCEAKGIRVIGNHVFDPACFTIPGITHEFLMRCTSALLPDRATILCGTRNPAHLRQSFEWAAAPFEIGDTERYLERMLP